MIPFAVIQLILRWIATRLALVSASAISEKHGVPGRWVCPPSSMKDTVRYARARRLVEEIMYARVDGTIAKLRSKLARLDLMIIDDFALSGMKKRELTDLLEIVEDRAARSSTTVIAQRAPEEWYGFIGDPLLTDAFMDRIRSRAHLLQLKGKSLR